MISYVAISSISIIIFNLGQWGPTGSWGEWVILKKEKKQIKGIK